MGRFVPAEVDGFGNLHLFPEYPHQAQTGHSPKLPETSRIVASCPSISPEEDLRYGYQKLETGHSAVKINFLSWRSAMQRKRS